MSRFHQPHVNGRPVTASVDQTGQSLVQAMKLRLFASEGLVDLDGVAGLKGMRDGSNAPMAP